MGGPTRLLRFVAPTPAVGWFGGGHHHPHSSIVAKEISRALALLRENRERLESLARQRADALLADHRRVREAARDLGTYTVTPSLPVDVIGTYVLLPKVL